jgi:hypothetical protein
MLLPSPSIVNWPGSVTALMFALLRVPPSVSQLLI